MSAACPVADAVVHMLADVLPFMLIQASMTVQDVVPAKVAFKTTEDWVALDSGKSFAWSSQQQGSYREQLDVLRKLVEQKQQVGSYLHLSFGIGHTISVVQRLIASSLWCRV